MPLVLLAPLLWLGPLARLVLPALLARLAPLALPV